MSFTVDHQIHNERFLFEVDRILHSDILRNAEGLRRLLKFLSEKTLSGEADHLKEYTVAIDAFEKPATYDPRHDSTVRIQAGRLRQKLAEYYRTEGRDDLTIIDLPKGRFKLTALSRPSVAETIPTPTKTGKNSTLIVVASVMSLALLIAIAWWGFSVVRLRRAEVLHPVVDNAWNTDLEILWRPFLATSRPLILVVEDPLFIDVGGGHIYRDTEINEWGDALNSPGVNAIRRVLKNSSARALPSHYYTTFGEANTAFLLGKLLGGRIQNMSLVRTSELSWQQLADNNVVYVGRQAAHFDTKLQGTSVLPQFVLTSDGVRDKLPKRGEPDIYLDHCVDPGKTDGEIYALVTRLPGPQGRSDIASFTSNVAPGFIGAVQWFTDPASAHILINRLRKPSGEIPPYYQALLKVRFKDQVPTETSYVSSRELVSKP